MHLPALFSDRLSSEYTLLQVPFRWNALDYWRNHDAAASATSAGIVWPPANSRKVTGYVSFLSRATIRCEHLATGRIWSSLPCEMNTFGRPEAEGTVMKPGENAITWVNTSVFRRPSERAYDPPSENPSIATWLGSIEQRRNAFASAWSMKSTSGPNPPSRRSHSLLLASGARRTIPCRSACLRKG